MIIPPESFITKPLHDEDMDILSAVEDEETILFEQETPFSYIEVTQSKYGRFLKFEDSYQAGYLTHNEYTGNLPYLNYFLLGAFLKTDIKNILILGFGTGQTALELLKYCPEAEKIDIVELEPEVIDISKRFFNYQPNPKINTYIQDARIYIQETKKKYDMVLLDLYCAEGTSYRFMTKEFLQEVSDILTPHGFITANIFSNCDFESYESNLFRSMLKTYKSIFSEIQLYPANYANELMFRTVFGLKHHLTDLINIIIFASKGNFTPLQDVNNFDNYIKDRYNEDIRVDNVKILLDSYLKDPSFEVENINEYLTDCKSSVQTMK